MNCLYIFDEVDSFYLFHSLLSRASYAKICITKASQIRSIRFDCCWFCFCSPLPQFKIHSLKAIPTVFTDNKRMKMKKKKQKTEKKHI